MTQQDLDREVARATGEDLCQIRRLGFSLASPLAVFFDPELADPIDNYLDWDDLDRVEQPRPDRRHRSIGG